MVFIEPVDVIVPEEVIIVPLSALKSIMHIYFDKTQLVLFSFYRNKSEKCQTCNSEVAQPLSMGFYQSWSVTLDHSWFKRIEKLKQLFVLFYPTYLLDKSPPCVSGKLLICRWSQRWNSVISEDTGSFKMLRKVQGEKLNTKGYPCTLVLGR